jgi:hypothetical protein
MQGLYQHKTTIIAIIIIIIITIDKTALFEP